MNAAEKLAYYNGLKNRIKAVEVFLQKATVLMVPKLNEELWNKIQEKIKDDSLSIEERTILSIGLNASDLVRLMEEYILVSQSLKQESSSN